MTTPLRKAPLALLVTAVVAGAGAYEPALRVLKHAYGADDVVEGFFPALCAGEMPPAELLALADWPLDREGIGCRPHAGVLDAVEGTAGSGGRPGSISRELAEYVLSLGAGRMTESGAPARASPEDAPALAVRHGAATPFAVALVPAHEGSALEPLRGESPQPSLSPNPEAVGVASAPGFAAVQGDSEAPSGLPPRVETLPGGSAPPIAGATSAPGSGEEPLLFSGMLVDDGTLGELRGGFETPGGLTLSFGIERVVYINGELASTTTLNIADLGQLVGRGTLEGLPVGASIAVIQNGPNNSFDAGALASGSFATVIQNSLDNQQIQTVTTINAQANSMDLLRANRLGESLRDAVSSSLPR